MAAAGVPTPASTLVFALLVVAAAFRPAVSSNPDAASLLSFKDAITSDPYGALSDWVPSDPNPCQWNGVTCKGGAVVSLALPKRSLAGLLSPDLGSLSSLRHLNLRDNQFHDLLPSGLFRATGLQSLALFGNLFSGPLPPEIGNLSSMQSLDLYRNSFNGSLPTSLLNCTRLKALRLAQNNFSGPLPAGFGNILVALEKLDISHNGFSGSIPADIGNLSSLQETVDLSYNNFSGPIPPALGELPEKVYIDLSFNALSGPIPQRGALASRGPTAFMGNPALCGPPLKNLCSGVVPAEADGLQWTSAPAPGLRGDNGTGTANRRGGGMRTVVLVAIVAGDVLGLCLIAGVFFYCFRRAAAASSHTKLEHSGAPSTSIGKCSPDAASSDAAQPQSMRCLCFRKKEDTDDASSSDDGEGTELVPLDRDVNFDLDELLKASAFVLGKSGVGIVYKVVLDDGVTLAVRRLGDGGSQRLKEFQAEIEAVAKVRHPNVVRLRAYYWSVDEKLLIYDYVPNGSLSAAIHGNIGLPWLVRLNIMRGIARGLTYLHEFSPKKYVHGDLKPATILLGHNMEPFISDFGLPRLANIAGGAASPLVQSNRMAASEKTQQSHHSSQAVSPVNSTTTTSGRAPYQAPESFKALKPSQKWDVYSYGVLVLELITGRSPVVLVGELEMNLVQWVQLCVEEKKPMSMVFDPFLFREAEREEEMVLGLNIGLACANVDPERRPPMRNVLESLERWSVVG